MSEQIPEPQATPSERVRVEALDAILSKKFPVLDDGFVRLVDYMGGDESIVQAARVSYGKGTKKVHEDEGLIRFLMRHRHTTPFEMCEIKLHVRVPMDLWRQWIRHRTANVNEYSTRYSEAIDANATTLPGEWRLQSKKNKQGSAEFLDEKEGSLLTAQEKDLHEKVRKVYQTRLSHGVAKEQARKDLSLSNYTEAYWKVDLHNLLHFLSLRMDSHAQLEIRQFANVIGEIVEKWCPMVWAAFKDYRLGAMFVSARDIACLRAVLSGGNGEAAVKIAETFGWLDYGDGTKLKGNRERAEFEGKLKALTGRFAPWESE
jgi:thymidylate synthase (FAD)